MSPWEGRTVVVVVVAEDGVRDAHDCADLGFVDALARLELAARRRGWSVRLRDTRDDLAGLLDLVGLTGASGAPGLALQADREPEGWEQLGIQEVVPPGDAPA